MSGTTCAICLEDAHSPVVVPCGHIHCESCLIKCIELCDDAVECPCPTCRAPFTIAIPDFRFVPQKYHAFMQPAVRRVYPSPSEVMQNLEARNERLQADNTRLREKIDALKRKNEHVQRDKERLMVTCEASQAAVANYREKERQLRDELESASEENDALEMEVAEWEKKYRDVKEKYSKLKKLVAEDKQVSIHSKKRKSTQAALEMSPREEPSNAADAHDRRLMAPLPKRPRLTSKRLIAATDAEDEDEEVVTNSRVRHWIDRSVAEASTSGTAYVGRRPAAPLQSHLTTFFDDMDVSGPDVSQELDAEERDGPSKARARHPFGDAYAPPPPVASASGLAHASSSRRGSQPASRAGRYQTPVIYRQAPRAVPRSARPELDVFASDDGSQGNLDFSLGSSPSFPPLEDEVPFVRRGRRVMRILSED